MKLISFIYIANSSILLLHEIGSAYWKEWKILKLQGEITGFIIIHIPLVILMFTGLLFVEEENAIGAIFGIITGIGGLIPFFVYKLIAKTGTGSNLLISEILIYSNIVTGLLLTCLSFKVIFW